MSETALATTIVVPYSGEVVALDAPPEQLAALLDEIKDVESKLRELKGEVSRVVHVEMDRMRKWTLPAGEFTLTGKSDQPETTYDADRLALLLTRLVEENAISAEAMDAAIEPNSGWKIKKAGINALRKSPQLAELIDACGEQAPPENRRLSVKRA